MCRHVCVYVCVYICVFLPLFWELPQKQCVGLAESGHSKITTSCLHRPTLSIIISTCLGACAPGSVYSKVMNIHDIMHVSQTCVCECVTAFWWSMFPSYPVLATKAHEYSWLMRSSCFTCAYIMTDGHVFLHIRCWPRTRVPAGMLVVWRAGLITSWSLSWSLCWSINMARCSQQCMHLNCYVDSQPHLGFQSMKLKRPFPIS